EDPTVDATLSKVVESVLKPSKRLRDKYAHALWLQDADGNVFIHEKESRTKPTLKPKPVTEDTIAFDALSVVSSSILFQKFLSGAPLDHKSLQEDYNRMRSLRPEGPPGREILNVQIPVAHYLSPSKPNKPQPLPRRQ